MSAQPARSSVPANHRSAHPNFPGVPWWGAVVIAVTATTIGFAFDAGSGDKELTFAFSALYFLGCVAAVLAVRQSGVFTAVVQPPLILFVAVPGAYFLFHQAEIDGIKDILINCGYPLIERFVLMFTTSLVVLLIGAARWYFGAASGAGTDTAEAAETTTAAGMRSGSALALAGLRTKLTALFGGTDDDAADSPDAERPRKHAPAKKRADTRRTSEKGANRPPPTRSRHARPPIDDPAADPAAPPRRRRPTHASFDDEPDLPPRRRPRPPREREPGPRDPSRDYRAREPREPRAPRDAYERPRRRSSSYEAPGSYDPAETFDAPPRPRRPAGGSGSTHHPVSRVRYRGSAEEGDDRVERHSPPRPEARHSMDSDRWRHDS